MFLGNKSEVACFLEAILGLAFNTAQFANDLIYPRTL